MTVMLKPDTQRFVEEKVRSGEYASPEEAVNALLAFVQEQQKLTPEDIAELRAEVDIGLKDADAGKFVDYTAEDIIAEGRAALASKRKNR